MVLVLNTSYFLYDREQNNNNTSTKYCHFAIYDYSPTCFGRVCEHHQGLFPVAMVSSFTRFLDHTQRLTTFGRTPLDA